MFAMKTDRDLVRYLCKRERGKKQVDIAQMSEAMSKLKQGIKTRRGIEILKVLIVSMALVTLVGCTTIEPMLKEIEVAAQRSVATIGAGTYTAQGYLTRDGLTVLSYYVRIRCDATADGTKLAGCHREAIEIKPLQ